VTNIFQRSISVLAISKFEERQNSIKSIQIRYSHWESIPVNNCGLKSDLDRACSILTYRRNFVLLLKNVLKASSNDAKCNTCSFFMLILFLSSYSLLFMKIGNKIKRNKESAVKSLKCELLCIQRIRPMVSDWRSFHVQH
jgi:hypothetical protein